MLKAVLCYAQPLKNVLRITTQQKCLNGREPEPIAIMAPWTWLHNNTDIQFHRTFSKYIPALRFPLKFTTSLIAEPSVHNVFKPFAYWIILYFLSPSDFSPKINFFEKFVRKTTRVLYSLDPDQVRTFVRPDLGPGCFKQLSNDDTSRQKKVWKCVEKYWVVCQAKIWLQERWCACVVGGRPGLTQTSLRSRILNVCL